MNSKPFIVGIAGGSCSGKTTLARALVSHLGHSEQSVSLVMQDSYYANLSHMTKAERDLVNFDHPDALDFDYMRAQLEILNRNESIQAPVYDFAQHQRTQSTELIAAAAVIVVEGTLILSQPALRSLFDLSVFVSADYDLRLGRRLERDINERGRTRAYAQKQFMETVEPMHQAFVDPSAAFADVSIDGSIPTYLALQHLLIALQDQSELF
jgi:uridine kinase